MRPVSCNEPYSQDMGKTSERGTAVEIPAWWVEELQAAMAARGWQQVDLARGLLPERLREDKRALNTAAVKVQRFLSGKHRTFELATELGRLLDVIGFVFTAATKDQALAMAELQKNPTRAARDVAVSRMLTMLESGEFSLDEMLSQSADVRSANGVERRGSRRAGAGSETTGRQRP